MILFQCYVHIKLKKLIVRQTDKLNIDIDASTYIYYYVLLDMLLLFGYAIGTVLVCTLVNSAIQLDSLDSHIILYCLIGFQCGACNITLNFLA